MKVGIITHYHGNTNYGGILQAYALCAALNTIGIESEQISFQMEFSSTASHRTKKLSAKKLLRAPVILLRRYANSRVQAAIAPRFETTKIFREEAVPHTAHVYTQADISQCAAYYDAFITGSDQVWNPIWYQNAYMLDFVPDDKIKLSYAASLGQSKLTDAQKELFAPSLRSFRGISVREKNAVSILSDISPVYVNWVLDPTLLLTAQQWDLVCSPRRIKEDYLFCYFLGNDAQQRKLAKQYAKRNGLKLVTVPYMTGAFIKQDLFFGDTRLFDVSPADFISLIKHANMVFTDSFHACVFSNLYKTPYFVFPRAGHAGMSSRLHTLSELFATQDRFCDTDQKRSQAYLSEHIKLLQDSSILDQKREESYNFLKKHLSTTSTDF